MTSVWPQQSENDSPFDRWYAVQIQPSRQNIAVEHLERQGFKTFAPVVCRRKQRRGGNVEILEPLFPGYVFAEFNVDQACWRSINGTLGVLRLVSFGECPQALPCDFIEALMGSADERGVVSFSETLRVGDRVRISGSAFDDLVGSLIATRPRDRVVVMLGLLGGVAPVELERERLVRV